LKNTFANFSQGFQQSGDKILLWLWNQAILLYFGAGRGGEGGGGRGRVEGSGGEGGGVVGTC